MPRKKFQPGRFRFSLDDNGNAIICRPNEILVRHDPDADDTFDDIIAAANEVASELRPKTDPGRVPKPATSTPDPPRFTRGARARSNWRTISLPSDEEVDASRVAHGLRERGWKAQPNHVYFVGTLGLNPNYLAPNYLAPNYLAPNYLAPNYLAPNYLAPNYLAPNYLAPNYLAPNYLAPNYLAPNYLAPNYLAPDSHGSGGAGTCGGCPTAPGDERPVPHIAIRKAWGPMPGPEPIRIPEGIDLQIHVLDARSQAEPEDGDELARLLDDKRNENPKLTSRDDFSRELAARRGALLPRAIFAADACFGGSEAEFEQAKARYLEEPTSAGKGANINDDNYVDPVVNHGEFIESIIGQILELNEHTVKHTAIAGTLGEVDDLDLAAAIDFVRENNPINGPTDFRILNLSLSGYTDNDQPSEFLAEAINAIQEAGWLVVASAGNNGSCRLAWPAALPNVISVAAYGPNGPAPFSNYGPWVDACAPGVDVVGSFPAILKEGLRLNDKDDPDMLVNNFAAWSGTSFSAPYVAAVIAGRIIKEHTTRGPQGDPVFDMGDLTTKQVFDQALEELILHPEAVRYPYHGTVVARETVRVSVGRSSNGEGDTTIQR